MNAKKNKNKKGNKQPNPTPPQSEDMEKSLEKIESENSDRADIISDTVADESDVPRKPKRNRGKKKKHDRDDEEKTPEPAKSVEASVISETEATISEVQPNKIEPIEEFIIVTVDTPIKVEADNVSKSEPVEQEGKQKKKNKKKKRHDSDRSDKSGDVVSCTAAFQKLLDVTDQTPEDAIEIESEAMEGKIAIENPLAMAEDEKGPNVSTEAIQETILPAEREERREEMKDFKEFQKHETKKKKHKKEKKFPPKTEDLSTPSPVEPNIIPPVIEAIPLGEVISEQLVTPIDTKDIALKDITDDTLAAKIEPLLVENVFEGLGSPIIQETVIEGGVADILPEAMGESEFKTDTEITKPEIESPKPKAKIAKPVDKKRKGKQDITEALLTSIESAQSLEPVTIEQSLEEINPVIADVAQKTDIILPGPEFKEVQEPVKLITEIDTVFPQKEVLNLEMSLASEILKPIEELTTSNDFIQVEKDEMKSETTTSQELLQPIEHQEAIKDKKLQESEMPKEMAEPTIIKDVQNKKDTPTDNKTGKKKRKPLKMPIPEPVNPEPITALEEMTVDLSKEGKEEIGDVESIFETLVPTDIELKTTDEKLDEILESKPEPVADTEKSSPEKPKQPEEKWTKPKRKGKKSLKMPPTPGIKDEPFSDLDTKPKDTEALPKEPEIISQSPTETLEIRSVKADDSECSPCDVTPDIVYPRSTSQLNIDDNNNTVIREITIPDTLNIPVGLTTPLIQGSGETPVSTPIMVSSFNITEIESPTEKTDIKSKMVEVNRDMEELRKSIERSLAELTSMEKSEEEIEKKYEEKHKLDVPFNIPDVTMSERTQTTNKESKDIQPSTEISKDTKKIAPLATQEDDIDLEPAKDNTESEPKKDESEKTSTKTQCADPPPVCPARRDNKGKGKKRKGKQDASQAAVTQPSTDSSKEKREEKTEQKTETKEQNKQDSKQKDADEMPSNDELNSSGPITDADYDPIEKFEDALTSSVDDVNKTFEMILNEVTDSNQRELASNKPDINITAPEEDFRESNVPQPKNLLGHPDIPVSSNKDDFKKEKHKTLNTKQAKVKIKDANDLELRKESKQVQTDNRKKSQEFSIKNSNENGDFIYKYSFRKVFLQNSCHVCAKDLASLRVPCNFCNLLFYCSQKHKDEDWPQHQALCFAISTIVHLKDQKHIYAEAKNITGQNYRLLRMQMILSCEKVLKRRLVPWEQEALLYPRICADVRCREWRQSKLKDCEGCGQISYCANEFDHLPKSHQRWCKSYALYQKLVTHQQTKGRLEPKLPTKVMGGNYEIPEKINEVLASMYEEQIDMNDIQYAALTQIATAPLTVAYSHQLCRKLIKPTTNGIFKKSSFVIHVLGAELQFEADVLNKWEVFFLHLRPDVSELVVVLISNNLNPGNLPLELLGKIRLCDSCREDKRRVIFSFQDKKSYQEYRTCDDFIYPDIVCAFNASINRSSYSAKDPWPGVITSVMRLRSPFLITSHTPTELHRDLIRVKECGEVKTLVDPRRNPFASVRPDRNFITDDETPLLFKNQCFAVLCGV